MIKKCRRVSAADVRKNAKEGPGGGNRWLKLPSGVEEYYPKKPGIIPLNIVPYEISTDNHPDGIEKGLLWYKLGVRIHFGPGYSVACPRSLDPEAKCPWCRQWRITNKKIKALEGTERDYSDKQKQALLKPFQGQNMDLYNILRKGEIKVFSMSYGKFTKKLKEELDAGDEKNMLFFETNKKGRTIKARFAEKKFMGKKFLECNRIDFVPRPPVGEEILEKVVDLDKAVRVLPYEKLEKLFLQSDEDEDEDEENPKKPKRRDDEDEEEPPKRKKKLKKGLKSSKSSKTKVSHGNKTKPRTKGKKFKKKSSSEEESTRPKCPVKGGRFGRDIDKFDECADCPLWNACEAASEG